MLHKSTSIYLSWVYAQLIEYRITICPLKAIFKDYVMVKSREYLVKRQLQYHIVL